MTLINVPKEQLPPAQLFLESVCPGLLALDDNIHFAFPSEVPQSVFDRLAEVNWPLTSSSAFPTSIKARLEPTYLHVSRPPFQHDVHRNVESTTYISLPFHVTNIFSKVVGAQQGTMKQDGGLHIGANLNPLIPDPYRLVHMNPGCLTSMIVLANDKLSEQSGNRNSFRSVTSSLNRFLRIGSSQVEADSKSSFHSLLDAIPDHSPHFISHPQLGGSAQSAKKSQRQLLPNVFHRLLEFDSKNYHTIVRSPTTKKLLVSANVNVVNVFAVDQEYKMKGTKELNATSSIFPLSEEADNLLPSYSKPTSSQQPQPSQQQQQQQASTTLTTTCKPYKKVIETPLLRLQLNASLIVTSILTLVCSETLDPMLILGFNTGGILAINLGQVSYRYFDNFGFKQARDESADASWSNVSVTSLAAIAHTKFELLVIAGFANGEVIILNLLGEDAEAPYIKREVGNDSSITLFKKFDLSPLNKESGLDPDDPISPGYIIGHFKMSYKPITSIASTIPYTMVPSASLMKNPFIVAIASDDGLVRLIDLLNTHNRNYGDPQNFYNHLIVSDVVASYFQDGICHIEFSPDHRFFVVGGKGDLIEIFKMTYYNINGLANKRSNHLRGRSRSGTVNSGNSFPNHAPSSLFLSATESATTSASFELGREDAHDASAEHSAQFPPMIKDMTIVSRLKGHTNTVQKVSFVQEWEMSKLDSHDDVSSNAYKLISCGADGKVIVWDFDSKAVSRVKRGRLTTRRKKKTKEKEHLPDHPSTFQASLPVSNRTKTFSGNLPASITVTKAQHSRTRSLSHYDDSTFAKTSFNNMGINKLLSPSPQPLAHSIEDDEEKQKIVILLYRWLYEIRMKKHYSSGNVTKDGRKKYTAIIHRVVNDEELPSIQIPSLEIDLSYFIKDGKIQNYLATPERFFIFGRSGDIFSYSLE
uniref:Uncharacterized protein n=1 Tax=Candidozyma auris TaxID=498019 RepID=A0A0L0NZN0_CANAR